MKGKMDMGRQGVVATKDHPPSTFFLLLMSQTKNESHESRFPLENVEVWGEPFNSTVTQYINKVESASKQTCVWGVVAEQQHT